MGSREEHSNKRIYEGGLLKNETSNSVIIDADKVEEQRKILYYVDAMNFDDVTGASDEATINVETRGRVQTVFSVA